ncbi:hypothetical protein GIB67_022254 [Kingdonia uniflora]|uniref:Aminotransferase-like plant mobile domain-containing protein n=1 Tax=Kingdonia uniflora TaxID=39325 RepID=A0A7J7M718_9MAGN|nr:hypothetical protein GIB67_022254 [Kingdonia uniflora]
MLYVLGSFLFPTKKGTNVSAWYLNLFTKDKVAKKWSWGLAVLAHMYYNLGAASRDDGRQFTGCTTLLEYHEDASLFPNAHDTIPTRGGFGGFDHQITTLNDQLQKLKEDKEKESEANINLREALNEKCKESESLKAVNALLMKQIDLHLPLVTPLAVLQSHQPVPNVTLAKKYDDLLYVHEDVKKKLIAKKDFRKKLVNVEERIKSLEVNNSEWVCSILNLYLFEIALCNAWFEVIIVEFDNMASKSCY